MKKLIFILFLIPSIMFAQTKYVKIPQDELDAVISAIDTLEYQDSIKATQVAYQTWDVSMRIVEVW